MSLQSIPSINRLFRLQFETAQDCYVLLFPEGMVKLNPSAGEIMARIDGEKTVSVIIKELQAQFPDAGDLTLDVQEFLTTAQQKKWLIYES